MLSFFERWFFVFVVLSFCRVQTSCQIRINCCFHREHHSGMRDIEALHREKPLRARVKPTTQTAGVVELCIHLGKKCLHLHVQLVPQH